MKDSRVQHLRDAIEGELGGLFVEYEVAQRIMQHIDAQTIATPLVNPSDKQEAVAWARKDWPVNWTRHGSGSNEWWSHDGYEARKNASGRWSLMKDGATIFEHAFLQEVMAYTAPQAECAPIAPRADAEKDVALTDEEILGLVRHYAIDHEYWSQTRTLAFARAILAAKEKKS